MAPFSHSPASPAPAARAAALSLALLAACGGSGGDSTPPPPAGEALRWPSPSYAQVQAIFTASCVGCHGANGGLSLAAPGSWASLVEVAAQAQVPAGIRVVPNDSAASVLFQRVTGTGLPAGEAAMPPPPGAALSTAAIETIRSWIDEGGARQDLSVALSGMGPHVGQKVTLRLQSDSGEQRTRVVLDPLPSADFDLFVPRAIPAGSHDLDVWADVDGDGAYDVPPADHAWRVPVPATGIVSFAHSTLFTDVGASAPVEPGSPFTLALSGMSPHLGQALTVAVWKLSTGPLDFELVGLYRVDAIPSAAFSIAIPGIIQPLEDYWVDLHADHDGDGAYDAPPTDHAWRVSQSAGAGGLDVTFTHGTSFVDVSGYPAG